MLSQAVTPALLYVYNSLKKSLFARVLAEWTTEGRRYHDAFPCAARLRERLPVSLSLLRRSTASAADMVHGYPPKRLYRFVYTLESILKTALHTFVSVMIFISSDGFLIV